MDELQNLSDQVENLSDQVDDLNRRTEELFCSWKRLQRQRFIRIVISSILGSLVGTFFLIWMNK